MMSRQKYLFPVKYLSCKYDRLLLFEIQIRKYKVVVKKSLGCHILFWKISENDEYF